MKNIIQKIRVLPILFLVGLFICVPQQVIQAMGPQAALSDDDLKFLEEAQKEVEKYVTSLPTEASLRAQGLSDEQIKKAETKEKFEQEVERLSKMSEEDLIKEIEKAIADVSATQTPQAQPELPPVNIRQEEEEKKPEPKPVIPSNKQLAAIQLIDSAIMSIDNFLRKAQMMVELPSKIPNWNKEGKLKGWPTGLTWNTFKDQIEDLELKLKKLKDRDPKSTNYKYLDDFIKDESLYNNLTKVKDAMSRQEPKIELSPFGIDKMNSESRQATRSVLLSLQEATGILGIPSSLDKIFEKYEPTAKKIKEAEEAAQKRALEQSRMGRIPGQITVGGTPARAREREAGRYDYERGGRYTPGEYEAPTRAGYGKGAEAAPSKGLGAPGGGAKPAEGAKKPEEGKKPETPKREKDDKADAIEKKFNDGIDTFKELLIDQENFNNIEKYFKDKNTGVDEELTTAIKTGTKALSRATGAVKSLKDRLKALTNDAQKKEYKKAVKDTFKEIKPDFEKMVVQINNLSSRKANMMVSLNPTEQINLQTKYYAYFNRESEPVLRKYVAGTRPLTAHAQMIEDFLAQTKNPANLNDLKTKIVDLKKAVDEL